VKELPLFLIAHNKQSKSKDTFILCTKAPAFIAKAVKFESKTELLKYIDSIEKEHFRILFKNEIIEVVSILDSNYKKEISLEKALKRMSIWWANYGEKEA
jgi:hypothetical protein